MASRRRIGGLTDDETGEDAVENKIKKKSFNRIKQTLCGIVVERKKQSVKNSLISAKDYISLILACVTKTHFFPPIPSLLFFCLSDNEAFLLFFIFPLSLPPNACRSDNFPYFFALHLRNLNIDCG